jgi:hypothetical protein
LSDIDDPPPGPALPSDLRFLKLLVMVLAGTMIAGLITIIALLVIRIGAAPARPVLPEDIALPPGIGARAITTGTGWIGIVTDAGDEILIYDATGKTLKQRIKITP